MYPVDLLNRRADRFVLWLPGLPSSTAVELQLAVPDAANRSYTPVARQRLVPGDKLALWELDPKSISPPLDDGVYRYWFKVGETVVTDPLAFAVDYAYTDRSGDSQPPGVVKYRDGKLWVCDVDGAEPTAVPVPSQKLLPANNHLVIYELPTSWAKAGDDNRGVDTDTGTFEDVRALFDPSCPGRHFSHVAAVRDGALLSELGINALELLPAADGKPQKEWGYATAHYFAPDYDLGTASELAKLVKRIQGQNLRFFTDVVMAFGHDPYKTVDFAQFHINANDEPHNPDAYQSHAVGVKREGWGGSLWRYIQDTKAYDPETGREAVVHPSWAFHKLHLARWVRPLVCSPTPAPCFDPRR